MMKKLLISIIALLLICGGHVLMQTNAFAWERDDVWDRLTDPLFNPFKDISGERLEDLGCVAYDYLNEYVLPSLDSESMTDLQFESWRAERMGKCMVFLAAYNTTILHFAVFKSKNDAVKDLLDEGANPNAEDKDGRTPLHWAANFGNLEGAKLLLASGANVNAKTNNGETPLSLATEAGHKDLTNLLRQHGAK